MALKSYRLMLSAIAVSLIAFLLAGCSGGGGESTNNAAAIAAPTGVTASVSGTTVTLTWNAVAGATSYNVYHSETPGVTNASPKDIFTDIPAYHQGQVLTVSLPGVDPGVYYAAMTAVNAAGESALSSPEVTVTVTGAGPGTGTTNFVAFNGRSVTTFSGAGSMGYLDGPQNTAKFMTPRGLATDGSYVYVAEVNNVIRAVAVVDGHAYTLAGNVNGFAGSTDGDGFAAGFNSPSGVAVGGGYLYVADTANSTIRRITLTSPFTVTTIAGSASAATGSADGVGASARFKFPRGVALSGNFLFVSDTGNNTIRKIDLTDNTVTTIAGNANAFAGSADGVGSIARFNFPYGLTVDPAGANLYIADSDNGAIRKLAIATNAVTTVNNTISSPTGIVTDGTTLLVTDAGTVGTGLTANTVAQIDIATGHAEILAGGGDVLGVSTDGIGTNATFNHPEGIAMWGTTLFVSDTLSHKLRKVE